MSSHGTHGGAGPMPPAAGKMRPTPDVSDHVPSANNAAMEALRNWQPAARGGTPISDSDTPSGQGYHVPAMLAACLSSCTAGTALGFASTAMPSIEHEPWYNLQASPPENRWVADVLLLGAAGGALLSGLPLWFLGSRKTLLLCALGTGASWLVVAASGNVVMLLGARAACGACLGLTTIGASLYVADVAPMEKRSLFAGLVEVSTNAGILASLTLSPLSWRVQAIVWALAPLGVLSAERYLIENPRWLMALGRRDEGFAAAARLYGFELPPDFKRTRPQDVDATTAILEGPWQLIPCLLLQVLREATCAQMFFCRSVQTMEGVVEDVAAPVAAAVMTLIHVVFATLFCGITHVTGRRHLLGVSALLVAFGFVAFPPFKYLAFSRWWTGGPQDSPSWSAVYSVNLLVLAYSVGLCHVPPLLTAELCVGRRFMRYLAAPVMWAARWTLVFLVLHFDDQLLALSPVIAGVALAVLAAVVVFLIPETDTRAMSDQTA
ncbi:solute carrier family 2, facilitated glucose transporter member 8-like isoform X2 [Haemaphysalis longicornis]